MARDARANKMHTRTRHPKPYATIKVRETKTKQEQQIWYLTQKPNSVKPKVRMNSKPEDIQGKPPFKKIAKYEGVVDYKIIRKIHRKIQANAPTIQSELGKRPHGLPGM